MSDAETELRRSSTWEMSINCSDCNSVRGNADCKQCAGYGWYYLDNTGHRRPPKPRPDSNS